MSSGVGTTLKSDITLDATNSSLRGGMPRFNSAVIGGTNHDILFESIAVDSRPTRPSLSAWIYGLAPELAFKPNTAPALDSHWLEGVSDLYPTRVSDTASGDAMFLNSKDMKAMDRSILKSTPALFD